MSGALNGSSGRCRYRSFERARKYLNRSAERNRVEAHLLNRLLSAMEAPVRGTALRALDIPAGTGRMSQLLREKGFLTFEGDLSYEMLISGGQSAHNGRNAVVCDLMGSVPFQDRSFDLVLIWRFLHHLSAIDLLEKVFQEAARLSQRWVIASFFHPVSLHSLQRKASVLWRRAPGCRYAYRFREIDHAARKSGLKTVKKTAQLPYLRDLWAVLLAK